MALLLHLLSAEHADRGNRENFLGLVCTGDSAGVRYGLVLDSRRQTVGGTQNAPEFRKIMPGGEARYKGFG
jgi:hypothetical protein